MDWFGDASRLESFGRHDVDGRQGCSVSRFGDDSEESFLASKSP
jgi:hypothetical protein